MLMDNSVFPNTCKDSHEDMLDHHDLIENFPHFETFCSEMRIWIPSKIILFAILIVTALEWPKSGF